MRRVLVDECIHPRLALLLSAQRPAPEAVRSQVPITQRRWSALCAGLLESSALPECIVETVRGLGWTGTKDWALIRQIQHRFDVFVTIDKGIEFEHNLSRLSFGIVVVTVTNNQMPSYERTIEQLVQGIERVAPGSVIHARDPELGED